MPEPNVSPLFNHAKADIILRSSDGVEFRLHEVILEMASPIFCDMFTLPQEASQGDRAQVVDVSETARTLEDLLSFCYPMERSEFLQLSRLRAVLHAAMKYDMAFLVKILKRNLTLFLPSEPLRIYAIACLTEDRDLARAAAKRLLDCPFPGFAFPPNPPPEYDILPATVLQTVHEYREKCAEAARAVFLDHKWMCSEARGRTISVSKKGNANLSQTWAWLACDSVSCAKSPTSLNVHGQRNCTVYPRAWWQKYSDSAAKELALRPFGSTLARAELTEPAIAEAAKCKTCGPKAAEDLKEYIDAMVKRVDEAISKIEITLSFVKGDGKGNTA
ncbi:hypothetical protein TRAPUB_1741 [Trametes pubescens]|uniref:BTB domain-containing protein n=1 Tax=Trametes pubescens TaxID=154538 RepID=A0A1M2VIJ1_TRAPU|nr:hypothetical protein TRAPUB_1741 [Trametes pubescens]